MNFMQFQVKLVPINLIFLPQSRLTVTLQSLLMFSSLNKMKTGEDSQF